MLTYFLILTIPTSALTLLYLRWEYRRRGKLTILGLTLLSSMLFLPNLVLHYAVTFELPSTPLDYVGFILGLVGITLCLSSVIFFRSVSKVICVDVGKLTIIGPYKWSRNPQYVGWFIFLLGFGLTDWSIWCFAALLVVAISMHLLVLVEEEHLNRSFGKQYVNFCQKVPRYFGRKRYVT